MLMSGGALVCDKTKKKTKKKIEKMRKKRNKTSRACIVFFVRLVRARFVIAKSAASSIKWTMTMGRRATGARETKCRLDRASDERWTGDRLSSFKSWRFSSAKKRKKKNPWTLWSDDFILLLNEVILSNFELSQLKNRIEVTCN